MSDVNMVFQGTNVHLTDVDKCQPRDNMVIIDLSFRVPGNFPVRREDNSFGFWRRGRGQIYDVVGYNHFLKRGVETRSLSNLYIMVKYPQFLQCCEVKNLDSLRQDFRWQNDIYDHLHLLTFRILLTNGAP